MTVAGGPLGGRDHGGGGRGRRILRRPRPAGTGCNVLSIEKPFHPPARGPSSPCTALAKPSSSSWRSPPRRASASRRPIDPPSPAPMAYAPAPVYAGAPGAMGLAPQAARRCDPSRLLGAALTMWGAGLPGSAPPAARRRDAGSAVVAGSLPASPGHPSRACRASALLPPGLPCPPAPVRPSGRVGAARAGGVHRDQRPAGAGRRLRLDDVPASRAIVIHPSLQKMAREHSWTLGGGEACRRHAGGRGPGPRGRAAGYNGVFTGENIAGQVRTAVEVVDLWMSSTEGHCHNIMDERYKNFGAEAAPRTAGPASSATGPNFGPPSCRPALSGGRRPRPAAGSSTSSAADAHASALQGLQRSAWYISNAKGATPPARARPATVPIATRPDAPCAAPRARARRAPCSGEPWTSASVRSCCRYAAARRDTRARTSSPRPRSTAGGACASAGRLGLPPRAPTMPAVDRLPRPAASRAPRRRRRITSVTATAASEGDGHGHRGRLPSFADPRGPVRR